MSHRTSGIEHCGSAATCKNRHIDHGFSLVELLIIVCIIMVIASIAIPNLMRSRMAANEAAAAASLRTINTAETAYNASFQNVGYSRTLAALSSGGGDCSAPSSTAACLIDETLAAGVKGGYSYNYISSSSGTIVAGYTVTAIPQGPTTGVRNFFSDQSAVIRTATGGPANSSSPPI